MLWLRKLLQADLELTMNQADLEVIMYQADLELIMNQSRVVSSLCRTLQHVCFLKGSINNVLDTKKKWLVSHYVLHCTDTIHTLNALASLLQNCFKMTLTIQTIVTHTHFLSYESKFRPVVFLWWLSADPLARVLSCTVLWTQECHGAHSLLSW